MKRGIIIFVFLWFDCLVLFSAMTSGSYRINTLYPYTTPNTDYKVSYSYRLLGNILPLGYTNATGARIGLFPEVLGLSRGPEATVENAYAFPNPCNIKYGCNGISFTKLTLRCEIRIFNIAGEQVRTILKNSRIESQGWDLKDSNNNTVPSGLYIFYIKDENGKTRKGKLVIIR
ncbi:MAG: T9SS type A sorting domain-containing protein [Elusimicrobiales bacterium]|nr:T9SS type A sorting domain-containing protein [Elusimicrobiales bacterium]